MKPFCYPILMLSLFLVASCSKKQDQHPPESTKHGNFLRSISTDYDKGIRIITYQDGSVEKMGFNVDSTVVKYVQSSDTETKVIISEVFTPPTPPVKQASGSNSRIAATGIAAMGRTYPITVECGASLSKDPNRRLILAVGGYWANPRPSQANYVDDYGRAVQQNTGLYSLQGRAGPLPASTVNVTWSYSLNYRFVYFDGTPAYTEQVSSYSTKTFTYDDTGIPPPIQPPPPPPPPPPSRRHS